MRKPRSDSKMFAKLTAAQQAQVVSWFDAGKGYADVSKLVSTEFAVRISESSLKSFWDHVCSARLQERLAQSARQANAFLESFREETAGSVGSGLFDEAIIGRIKQRIFERAALDQLDDKLLDATLDNFTRWRAQDLKGAELKLKRDKFEFDAASACLKHLPKLREIAAQPKVSQADKINQIRQMLFGELP